MIRKAFYLLLLPLLPLFATDKDLAEAIDFGGDPSGIVGGCVNVITGDLVFNEDDLVIRGHEPIHIRRQYFKHRASRSYAGWEFGTYSTVALLNAHDKLYVREKSGLKLPYSYKPTKVKNRTNSERITLELKYGENAYTNTSLKGLSARHNPLNNCVYLQDDDPKNLIVEGADGSIRTYRTDASMSTLKSSGCHRNSVYYYLQSEKLPNGNYLIYKWEERVDVSGDEKKQILMRIESRSKNGKVFAWVNFQYCDLWDKFQPKVTIATSDNRKLIYLFDLEKTHKNKNFCTLREIQYPNQSNRQFHYWKSKLDFYPKEVILPNKRQLKVDFIDTGYDRVYEQKFGEKNVTKQDPRYTRVSQLYEPRGTTSKLYPSYTFVYPTTDCKSSKWHTEVYDAHNNLSEYWYGKKRLLNSIKRFDNNNNLVSNTQFDWDDNNRITCETLNDNTAEFPSYKTQHIYRYSAEGNVEKEHLTSNLKGPVQKDKQNKFEYQTYTILRNYDNNNLLKKESFPNGKIIEYQYKNGTDLLTAKFIHGEQNTQQLRSFYTYDDTILTCEITDNGTTKDPNDLTNVSQRLIKRITPNQDDFMYGMPYIIEEKHLDLTSHQEILLSKKVIHYDPKDNGKISAIQHYNANDEYQYTLNYTYNDKERLISQTDPLGRIRTLDYDPNLNLNFDHDPNEDYALTQEYDYMNRPTLTTQTTPQNKTRTSTAEYNRLNQKICETDFRGNSIRYEYDPFDNPTRTEIAPIYDQDGQAHSPTITCTYNALGKILTKTDPEGNTTTFKYTARGDPHQITYPDGAQETYLYDISGNVETHTSPTNTKTTFTYDHLNRITEKNIYDPIDTLISHESFTYDAFKLLTKTDPDGAITTYTYDDAGRQIETSTTHQNETRTIQCAYDSFGRIYKTTRLLNDTPTQITIKTFDLLDRVTEQREEDIHENIYSCVTYTYDDFSNKIALTKKVQVGEAIQQFDYDPFRRLVKATDPLGHTTTIEYDDYHTNIHNQKVLKKTTTNPKGIQTIEIYDVHDNLSILEKHTPQGTLLLREEIYYNRNKQKTHQVSLLYNPSKTIIKSWTYDSCSRLKTQTEAPETPLQKTTTYSYTPSGQIKQITKPDSNTITYTYDALDRQKTIMTSDGTCHYEIDYDKMGNIITSYDHIKEITTTRQYNHFGDLLHETLANDHHLSSTYDDLGRRTSLTFANNSSVTYTYDPYHLITITRLDSTQTPRYTHHYDRYDQNHNLIQERSPLGAITHTIDLLSRRIQTTSPYSHEQITSIDTTGNVTSYLRQTATTEQYTYTYDDLDQLTQETGPFNHNYSHDAHHNRLHKDETPYTHNELHQLTSAETTYTHDANGNRIAERDITYTYDGLDRLASISTPTESYRFTYDSFNRLITTHSFAIQDYFYRHLSSENYLYDNQNELGLYPYQYRILGQGLGAEIGATIAIEGQTALYIPAHDLFGNIIALQNPSHKILETYRYSAFGEEQASSTYNPWRYQSKRKIGHLVTFGRRFYDPETGRWLSPILLPIKKKALM